MLWISEKKCPTTNVSTIFRSVLACATARADKARRTKQKQRAITTTRGVTNASRFAGRILWISHGEKRSDAAEWRVTCACESVDGFDVSLRDGVLPVTIRGTKQDQIETSVRERERETSGTRKPSASELYYRTHYEHNVRGDGTTRHESAGGGKRQRNEVATRRHQLLLLLLFHRRRRPSAETNVSHRCATLATCAQPSSLLSSGHCRRVLRSTRNCFGL